MFIGIVNQSRRLVFFFQAEDGIRDKLVTGVQTCALPISVLGLPPVWYKSAPYRSRAVSDPRGVLRDFGCELPPDTEIRIWDSTAEIRYIVLRSEERRVGKERSARGATIHKRKNSIVIQQC